MQGARILVVDDEPELLQLVAHILARAGARVYTATSGQEGLRQFYAQRPDLVLLDIMMPEMDGWEVCRRVRQFSDVPVIMLTALRHDGAIIRGLDSGADDYVTKPFSPEVLLARVRAALRRAAREKPAAYSDGYLTIDLERRRVLARGEPVRLSPTEYRLLAYLFRNAGHVLTFEQILYNVWGLVDQDCPEYVHVYIARLRRKLEADPERPAYLLSERGVGYCFEKAPPQAGGKQECVEIFQTDFTENV